MNIDRRCCCCEDIGKRLADLVTYTVELINPLALYYDSVCDATGMDQSELIEFLESKQISHSEFGIDIGALDSLKKWYLKKMRRYLRNALAHGFESGIADEIAFYEFCREYRKFGHREVKSWNDIDEERLLKDFVSKCLADSFDSSSNYKSKHFLLDQIHTSYLFHLRLKKPVKTFYCRVKTILSFILCNRYHIFTTEADANAETTDTVAIRHNNKWLIPPRQEILYGLAS